MAKQYDLILDDNTNIFRALGLWDGIQMAVAGRITAGSAMDVIRAFSALSSQHWSRNLYSRAFPDDRQT